MPDPLSPIPEVTFSVDPVLEASRYAAENFAQKSEEMYLKIQEMYNEILDVFSLSEFYNGKTSYGAVINRPTTNIFTNTAGVQIIADTNNIPPTTVYVLSERRAVQYVPADIGLRPTVDANGWEPIGFPLITKTNTLTLITNPALSFYSPSQMQEVITKLNQIISLLI